MHIRNRSRSRRAAAANGVARALLLTAPLVAAFTTGAPAPVQAAVLGPLALAANPMTDRELGSSRGGFAVGGFNIDVGVVARSVIDRTLASAGNVGERLEVITRFTVPTVGRLTHAGTTVQALGAAATKSGSAATDASDGVTVSSHGMSTVVDIGGSTRLTQNMLNTFVENADVGRVITNQLDINLKVGGVSRQLGAAQAARAMRPTIQAQILYGPR